MRNSYPINIGESIDSSDNNEITADEPAANKKEVKTRACLGCRSSKTKCIPITGQTSCQACSRISQACIMPGPPKQRTRTAHRVSELEKQVQKLTDALTSEKHGDSPTRATLKSPGEATSTSSLQFQHQALEISPLTDRVLHHSRRLDLIDRGVVQISMADLLVQHWKQNMAAYLPSVSLSSTTMMQIIRTSRPLVFLAILVVASASVQPILLPKLLLELNIQFAERVFMTGERSLDLVQALMVYTTHFIVPAQAEKSTYTQYVHCAMSVSLDLGLEKGRSKSRTDVNVGRRTWLACYYTNTTVATLFRHNQMIRSSEHVDQCVHDLLLQTEHESDVWLCHLIGLCKIIDEAALTFELDKITSSLKLFDAKCKFQLANLNHQLEDWRVKAPKWISKGVIDHNMASTQLYIHSIALRAYEQNQYAERTDKLIDNAEHFDALRICLEASHKVINEFISFSIAESRSLPTLYLLWTVYAMVTLIKLSHFIEHMSAMLPSSYTSTSKLLDSLVARLAEVSKDEHWPPAKEVGVLVAKLRAWYLHKRAACESGDPACNIVDPRCPVSGQRITVQDQQSSTAYNHESAGDYDIQPLAELQYNASATVDDTMAIENVAWHGADLQMGAMDGFDLSMQEYDWMNFLYEQQPSYGLSNFNTDNYGT